MAGDVVDPAAEARRRRDAARLHRLEAYVHRHIDRRILLDELVIVAGLGSGALNRWFNRVTGTSPAAWVQELRLAMAERLLLEGALNVTAVAVECGFYDQAHLANAFRKSRGVSPSHWLHGRIGRRPPRKNQPVSSSV